MYYVYILESEDKGLYIGYSADLKTRITNHNEGKGSRTTRLKKKWKLIYYEAYCDQQDALGRERFLKSGSGHRFIKKQLAGYLGERKHV